jgi:EAL domain-containing protein (putative c-di-GMP-specific phosphodiesterase class I)
MADAQSRSIVDAVSRLSHSLGKSVVAEGVEDAQQLAAVREIGCDVAQGYLFSKPMRAEYVPTFFVRYGAQRSACRDAGVLASPSMLKR